MNKERVVRERYNVVSSTRVLLKETRRERLTLISATKVPDYRAKGGEMKRAKSRGDNYIISGNR